MTKEGEYMAYCFERYRYYKGLSGREAAELFDRYGVFEKIIEFYLLMHINSERCMLQDIDEYIETEGGTPPKTVVDFTPLPEK